MAEESIALLELVEKYADGELFRELGQFVLQRLMELEEENAKLKRMYADMALENTALKDLIVKKGW